jgi:hypothetical protein
VEQIAKDNNLTVEELGEKIGRPGSSLGRSLRDGVLKVRDLKLCLECNGEELIITYKGEKYTL